MSRPPAGYLIRVAGHLDEHWSPWLGGLVITHDADGDSTLSGAVVDQSRLHGVLTGLRDIGATVLEVRPAPPSAAPSADECPPDPQPPG